MLRDISHYIADIAYNSLRAGAGRLDISVAKDIDRVTLIVRDDVCTDREALREASSKTPPVGARSGLGLPYLRSAVEKYRGSLDIDSDSGGTTIKAVFSSDIEKGNVGDAIATLVTEDREVQITLTLIGEEVTTIDVTEELKKLGATVNPVAIKLVKELINLNQKSILGGTTV